MKRQRQEDKGKEKEKDEDEQHAAVPKKPKRGGGVLDKIMGSIDVHQVERGKPTLSVEAQEFITKLSQILAFQEESMEGNLEIELRFGIIDETRFQPGIKKEEFGALYKHLKEKQTHYRFYKQTISLDYYYPGETKEEKFRASYDEKTHACIEALTKSSIMNRDLNMRTRPTFLYDLRVAVANEYEEDKPETPPPNPAGVRRKERWSFIDSVHKYWTIDMTRITLLDPGDIKTVIEVLFELEIELLPSTVSQLQNPAYNKPLCEQLWTAISMMQREIKRSGVVIPTAPTEVRERRVVPHHRPKNSPEHQQPQQPTKDATPEKQS